MGTQRLRKDFNELELLLAESLQSQLNGRRGKGSVLRLKAIDETLHQSFANPDNWDAKGVVCVTYVEPNGHTEPVGIFQELIHRRTQARKLVRMPTDLEGLLPPNRIEYFTDQYLFHPKVDSCPPAAPANPYERQAIRDYLIRTQPQNLAEFLGSKADATALLAQLKEMQA